jgi:hypothetical protein
LDKSIKIEFAKKNNFGDAILHISIQHILRKCNVSKCNVR